MASVLLWKNEPVSPLSSEEASLLDETFYQSDLDDIKLEQDDDLDNYESKAEVASHILENLEKLVDLDELIKTEPSFLLDDKMLPLLDDVEPPRGAVAVPVPLKAEYYKTPEENTTYLFNEFEKVYYELHHGTLTPPQSPPTNERILVTLEPFLGNNNTYQPQQQQIVPQKEAIYTTVPDSKPLPQVLAFPPINEMVPQQNHLQVVMDNSYAPVPSPQPDIAHELAVVDELVRSTVEDMQCWSSGPSSPESSSNSNFGDSCSSDDPEWVPETIESYNDTSFSLVQKSFSSRKRSGNKPYSDDKKSRKKEQNKNAATRYRMKKKAEVEEILNEEKVLMKHHNELDNQITDLQREIKYLKGLMRDLLKAKGIIH